MANVQTNSAMAPRYENGEAVFDMGEHTLRVPMKMHDNNRKKLVTSLNQEYENLEESVIVLQGGDDTTRYSSDMEHIFRQESYFHWAFGVLEPGWYGTVEIKTGRSTLFCPRLPEEYAIWMGPIARPEDFKLRYAVDEVKFVDQIFETLKLLNPVQLLTLKGVNSDSGKTTLEASFKGIAEFKVNNSILHDVMADCRVIKSDEELQILRFAATISCQAHRAVMRQIRPGMKEYQLESIFRHHSYYYGGCRHQSYTSICGCGPSGAVLHYGHAGAPNLRDVKDGDMCLFDMGSEYHCYTSDVTCSFPANGKFTADQKMIYNAVLAASLAVFKAAKPGVSWVKMHEVSYFAMLNKLKEGGLLKGDVEDMMKVNLGAVFQPHGLGHLLGLDVHDVGGYLPNCPERQTLAGYRNLRTARILKENMVLTIEPGCYFIEALLEKALSNPDQSKFIDVEALNRFRTFGGVRIEDDVVIISDGVENMSRFVPRTVEEIEAVMASGRKEESVHVPQLTKRIMANGVY